MARGQLGCGSLHDGSLRDGKFGVWRGEGFDGCEGKRGKIGSYGEELDVSGEWAPAFAGVGMGKGDGAGGSFFVSQSAEQSTVLMDCRIGGNRSQIGRNRR